MSQNLEFALSSITNLLKFSANNFSMVIFSQLFQQMWNQRKILRIFEYSYAEKQLNFFGGHWVLESLRMQIHKKWLNQLKNVFNKHFKEYYLATFAGESHQVVKITVL